MGLIESFVNGANDVVGDDVEPDAAVHDGVLCTAADVDVDRDDEMG